MGQRRGGLYIYVCVGEGGYHWHTPTLRLGSFPWRQISAISRFFLRARDGGGVCVCVWGGGGGLSFTHPTLRLGSSLWRQISAVSRFFWWARDGGSIEQKNTGEGTSSPARTAWLPMSAMDSSSNDFPPLATCISLTAFCATEAVDVMVSPVIVCK